MRARGEVRLVVPAKPEYIGLARVTTAGLASRLGFSYDEVEDLRLAIDEICFAMTGNEGRDGTLELRFLLGPEGITVEGRGHFQALGRQPELSELSELMLGALVDEHFLDGAQGPLFTLSKRHRPGPAKPQEADK